jgi:hypothetical protein
MKVVVFSPFGFLAPRFCLSCLGPLVFLLPDFGYPVEALWFSCSQILSILFRPGQPKSGSKNTKGPKQDSKNLRAKTPKCLNRIAKIWEQEHQRA